MAKTYTYNAWAQARRVYVWSGGAWSADHSADTVFDYFPDTAVAGDMIYFAGVDGECFNKLKLYVGTPIAASSVTFAWEYCRFTSYSGRNWDPLPNLVNGDALLTAGEQIVTWDVPVDGWYSEYSAASPVPPELRTLYVRCRIVSVSGLTEGGAQSTQTVQVGDNEIVVTGGTSSDPVSIRDLYAYAQAQGWGTAVELIHDARAYVNGLGSYRPSVYRLRVNLKIGDGVTETHFAVGKKPSYYEPVVLFFGPAWGASMYTHYANLYYGRADYGGDMAGVSIYSGSCGYYRSRGQAQHVNATSTITAYWTRLFLGKRYDAWMSGNLSGVQVLRDVEVVSVAQNGDIQVGPVNPGSVWERVTFRKSELASAAGFRFTGKADTIIDTYWSHISQWTCTNGGSPVWITCHAGEDVSKYKNQGYHQRPTLLDCNGWLTYVLWNTARTLTRAFTLDLTVIDEAWQPLQGVTVEIKDATGAVVATEITDANGQIPSQALTYEQAQQEANSGTNTTWTSHLTGNGDCILFTPHTVTLSKTGLETRVLQYTMDQTRDEVEMLKVPTTVYVTIPKETVSVTAEVSTPIELDARPVEVTADVRPVEVTADVHVVEVGE